MDCRMYVEAEVGKKVGPYALKPFCPPPKSVYAPVRFTAAVHCRYIRFLHPQSKPFRARRHRTQVTVFITAPFYCWSWLRRELGMSSAYVCRSTLESILSARASF